MERVVVFNISRKLKVGKYRHKTYNMWKKKKRSISKANQTLCSSGRLMSNLETFSKAIFHYA